VNAELILTRTWLLSNVDPRVLPTGLCRQLVAAVGCSYNEGIKGYEDDVRTVRLATGLQAGHRVVGHDPKGVIGFDERSARSLPLGNATLVG
jgi:hypothetical protein